MPLLALPGTLGEWGTLCLFSIHILSLGAQAAASSLLAPDPASGSPLIHPITISEQTPRIQELTVITPLTFASRLPSPLYPLPHAPWALSLSPQFPVPLPCLVASVPSSCGFSCLLHTTCMLLCWAVEYSKSPAHSGVHHTLWPVQVYVFVIPPVPCFEHTFLAEVLF